MKNYIEKAPVTLIGGYRPDIDGLRAIAVLAVIFYHFKVGVCSGGFVGVDIFFVISGYLITKGILSKQRDGKFDFADFYFRRVRRLIPALFVTITASYAVAFAIFSPADFKSLSGSTVYALTGLSNIFFWLESGYFDTASSMKPLLHTWSLSVEIQFYILWPLMLLLVTRFTKHHIAATLILIIVGGVAAVAYLNIDASGAFYLTPFRMHEFLFGALVVLLERFKLRKGIADAAYLIGLVLVAYSIFFFSNETTLFPGLAAMAPAAGAALMILAGENASLAVLCRSKVATKIGEISYSLYLVHWPIFVFTSYVLIDGVPAYGTVLLVTATFLFASVLYRFIEKPFRNPKKSRLTGAEFSLAALGCSTLIIILSASSWGQDGWSWRIPEEVRKVAEIDKAASDKYVFTMHDQLSRREFDKASRKEKILIIGDSQSGDLINILNESGYLKGHDVISRKITSNCATPWLATSDAEEFLTKLNPLTFKSPTLIKICSRQILEATNLRLLKSADKIFIAMYWRGYAKKYYTKAIEYIVQQTQAKIYVFGRKDLSRDSAYITSKHGRISGLERFAVQFKSSDTSRVNIELENIKNTIFVDMMKATCPSENKCLVLSDEYKPIFFDTQHLTSDGAKAFGSSVTSML